MLVHKVLSPLPDSSDAAQPGQHGWRTALRPDDPPLLAPRRGAGLLLTWAHGIRERGKGEDYSAGLRIEWC